MEDTENCSNEIEEIFKVICYTLRMYFFSPTPLLVVSSGPENQITFSCLLRGGVKPPASLSKHHAYTAPCGPPVTY